MTNETKSVTFQVFKKVDISHAMKIKTIVPSFQTHKVFIYFQLFYFYLNHFVCCVHTVYQRSPALLLMAHCPAGFSHFPPAAHLIHIIEFSYSECYRVYSLVTCSFQSGVLNQETFKTCMSVCHKDQGRGPFLWTALPHVWVFAFLKWENIQNPFF